MALIKERQSWRASFDMTQPVTKQDIHQILEAGSWAPTAHNMQNFEVVVVDDKILLEKISAIEMPVSETFVRENYLQLSFSEEELRRKGTGVLGTMFPKSWLHPVFVPGRADDEEEDVAVDEPHSQLLWAPVLCIMLYDPHRRAPASEGDFLGIMSLGCVLENMWLMAASLGIGFHAVSSLSNNHVEKEVKRLLNIPGHLTIAISFRLGYPLTSPRYLRVRREVRDFAHHNSFGIKSL